MSHATSGPRMRQSKVLDKPLPSSRSGVADPGELASAPVMRSPGRETGAQPGFVVTREVIAGLHERLDRLERLVELVIQKLDRR